MISRCILMQYIIRLGPLSGYEEPQLPQQFVRFALQET